MAILVTGGAGFVGSHLCETLVRGGSKVICLDNLYTGSRTNIASLLLNPLFQFVEHDTTKPFETDEKIEAIYNLACPASPEHYQAASLETLAVNTIGLTNMLTLARHHNASFLQASTSEVYGDPEVHPQRETYRGNVNPFGPRACYDEGKRVAETLCYEYHRLFGVRVKVVRIFNTFGPRMAQNDGRVVSNFIVQALRGEPITLYGDGSQTRSFCYVDDLVRGLIAMMNSSDEVTGPINLGNPGERTMRVLAEMIVALTGSKSEVVCKELPVDDPRRRCPDVTQAKAVLGWEPLVPVEMGLEKTIQDFKVRLGL